MDKDLYQGLEINSYLEPLTNSKYTDGIGISYCNLVSWKIMQLIFQKNLNCQYTFLHIPKSMKTQTASEEIDNMLIVFKAKLSSH